ncbi:hypothetical protein DQ384_30660 [Sphaerisporangium album]|uniref:Secreted protein n=1 Tax=Sphaerisporangium album TaxID=509200 RepID=A0A367F8J9_9ACTN|nr:hypothetical protein [Sphaerisporangium album]RCG25880.1 hypothetical protein DQ384_30660 [Sphaerisporangium album]
MRIFTMSLIGAAAIATAAGVIGLGGPAYAETIVKVTNSSSVGAQGSHYTTVKCPSTSPYVVSASASSKFADAADSKSLRYNSIDTLPDGQTVKVDYQNLRTYQEDAKKRVVVTVDVTVTCSNVDHGRPATYDFAMKSFVPLGGDIWVTSPCPANKWAQNYRETHSDWVTVTDEFRGLTSASVRYHNPDYQVPGVGEVTVVCGG